MKQYFNNFFNLLLLKFLVLFIIFNCFSLYSYSENKLNQNNSNQSKLKQSNSNYNNKIKFILHSNQKFRKLLIYNSLSLHAQTSLRTSNLIQKNQKITGLITGTITNVRSNIIKFKLLMSGSNKEILVIGCFNKCNNGSQLNTIQLRELATVKQVSVEGVLLAESVIIAPTITQLPVTCPDASTPFIFKGKSSLFDDSAVIHGRTYYVSSSGDKLGDGSSTRPWKSIQKAVDTLNAGDGLIIRPGSYKERVVLPKSGVSGSPIVIKGEGDVFIEEPVSQSWNWNWDGLFQIGSRSWIVVSNIKLKNSHWAGFFVSVDSASIPSNVIIQNSSTYNTGSSGIYAIKGDNIIVRGNVVQKACYQTSLTSTPQSQEAISIVDTSNFSVYQNELFESGVAVDTDASSGGEGITIKGSSNKGRVFNNYVHDLFRAGIYIDSYDKVFNDVSIYNNVVKNCKQGIGISSEAGGRAERIKVYNNILSNNLEKGIVVSGWLGNGPRKDIDITHNTIYRNGFQMNGGGISVESQANIANITIRNNIVSGNNLYQIQTFNRPEVSTYNNLIDGFRNATGEVTGSASVEGSPAFMNPDLLNFNLGVASKAVDTAVNTDLNTDIYDQKRPQGTAPDIGAVERNLVCR